MQRGLQTLGSEITPSGLPANVPPMEPGLGFPWAAVAQAGTQLFAAAAPAIFGQPEDPRAKAMREARRYKAAQQYISSDLQNLTTELENTMTAEEAVPIIENNAQAQFTLIRNEYEAVFRDQGVPDYELLATTAAEAARTIYLEVAGQKLLWNKAPTLALGAAGVLGALAAVYFVAFD